MRYTGIIVISFLLLCVGWLALTMLELAIENDGLKQVLTSERRSIYSLLDYVAVATRCDITSEEIAAAVPEIFKHKISSGEMEIFYDGFRIRFEDEVIKQIGVNIINEYKTVVICNKQGGFKSEVQHLIR